MDAADVVRIVSGDPGAYEEAFRLAAGLTGVDWAEVGSKFLAATLARLSWQAAHAVGEAGGRRAA